MNIFDLYALPTDARGWRLLPNGNRVMLGNGVHLGNHVQLGNWVKLGNGVHLGNEVQFSHTPTQIQCHPYLVYQAGPDLIAVGCIQHPLAYWRSGEPEELAYHPECLPWEPYADAIRYVADHMVQP